MRFPDISELGKMVIEDSHFTVYLVADKPGWKWMLPAAARESELTAEERDEIADVLESFGSIALRDHYLDAARESELDVEALRAAVRSLPVGMGESSYLIALGTSDEIAEAIAREYAALRSDG